MLLLHQSQLKVPRPVFALLKLLFINGQLQAWASHTSHNRNLTRSDPLTSPNDRASLNTSSHINWLLHFSLPSPVSSSAHLRMPQTAVTCLSHQLHFLLLCFFFLLFLIQKTDFPLWASAGGRALRSSTESLQLVTEIDVQRGLCDEH